MTGIGILAVRRRPNLGACFFVCLGTYLGLLRNCRSVGPFRRRLLERRHMLTNLAVEIGNKFLDFVDKDRTPRETSPQITNHGYVERVRWPRIVGANERVRTPGSAEIIQTRMRQSRSAGPMRDDHHAFVFSL